MRENNLCAFNTAMNTLSAVPATLESPATGTADLADGGFAGGTKALFTSTAAAAGFADAFIGTVTIAEETNTRRSSTRRSSGASKSVCVEELTCFEAFTCGLSFNSTLMQLVLGQCGAADRCQLGGEIRQRNEPIATSCSRGCKRLWHKRCWRSQLTLGGGCQIGVSRCPSETCPGLLKWRGRWTEDIGAWHADPVCEPARGEADAETTPSSFGEAGTGTASEAEQTEEPRADVPSSSSPTPSVSNPGLSPRSSPPLVDSVPEHDSALDGLVDQFGHLIVGELDPLLRATSPAVAPPPDVSGEPEVAPDELAAAALWAEEHMAQTMGDVPDWRAQTEVNLAAARAALLPAAPPRPLTDCCICLEPLCAGEERWLPCFHAFHHSCIHEWLERATSRTCPECCHPVPLEG